MRGFTDIVIIKQMASTGFYFEFQIPKFMKAIWAGGGGVYVPKRF